MSIERHYFPGNNTPKGFYSYYSHILGQREANRIICIKGGPGTGKSTFLRRIGEDFAGKGEDVDFLHCSADENSLDGIVLHGKKAALIDATSPHMTDPISPGAVDKIINLGEYWDEKAIAVNKTRIIDYSEETARWYRICYNYLSAAKSISRSMEELYNESAECSELYRAIASIVETEFRDYDISLRPGKKKRFFASAITASGTVHYLDSLLTGIPGRDSEEERKWKRIYIISAPAGYSTASFMEILSEGAIYRGLDIEAYYCAMSPDEKIEHLLIPAAGTAFITVNKYHDLEPWEICREGQELVLMDAEDYMDSVKLEENRSLISAMQEEYDSLLGRAVRCLEKAKSIHAAVEAMYIPNMDFAEVEKLREQVCTELNELK
ncbi:MAG: hypothetical protein IKU09_10555 [Firmicutes bacterium]|nr:hypothetical protein [Bacillota bacterium]